MTGLRIIAGRQEPNPHGVRARNMTLVKGWLVGHPGGADYGTVARMLDLSLPAVTGAALDLHLFDPDLLVSVPAPKNGYTLRAGWNDSLKRGEGNQARHAATRLERLSIRWEKIAEHRTREGKPEQAFMFRTAAANALNEARELREVADVLG